MNFMQMNRPVLLMLLIVLCTALNGQNQVIPLWEGDPPNYRETGEVTVWDTSDIVRVRHVQKPDLAVFLPSTKNTRGDAVVICPGGGYRILAYDWEGTDIARWLNSKGIAAFVLKYRLPGSDSNIEPHLSPLLDIQRAIRMVRAGAGAWNIDTDRIGVMGFSAGGHLASTISTHFDSGDPGHADPVERVSCRPDFSILVYPVISMNGTFIHQGSRDALLGPDPDSALVANFSNQLQVREDTPPAILIHSGDDRAVPVENSLTYYRALQEFGIPSELHIYPSGGHGYSLAIGMGHLSTWPDRVLEWLNYIHMNHTGQADPAEN